jgi:hypothetical protein
MYMYRFTILAAFGAMAATLANAQPSAGPTPSRQWGPTLQQTVVQGPTQSGAAAPTPPAADSASPVAAAPADSQTAMKDSLAFVAASFSTGAVPHARPAPTVAVSGGDAVAQSAIVPVSAPTATASSATSTPVSAASKSPTVSRAASAKRSAPATPAMPATSATPAKTAPKTAGLDDATVTTLVRQWEPDLTYCYTEFGTQHHPDLTGSLGVRITIAPDGTVSAHSVVTRLWSEPSGFAPVESCVAQRIAGWRFPPASESSVHEFTLNFTQ